jgi:hypothetical protein
MVTHCQSSIPVVHDIHASFLTFSVPVPRKLTYRSASHLRAVLASENKNGNQVPKQAALQATTSRHEKTLQIISACTYS